MNDINGLINADPFASQVFELRVPIRKGEAEFKTLTLRSPVLGDILRTDGHDPSSVAYAVALLSALSGVPEIALHKIVPEDWADLKIILALTNMRFTGQVNLLDKKEEETGDPTKAAGNDTPPPNSEPISGA